VQNACSMQDFEVRISRTPALKVLRGIISVTKKNFFITLHQPYHRVVTCNVTLQCKLNQLVKCFNVL